MFLLDENILEGQRVKLTRWRYSVRQIGFDIGYKGMDDKDDIVPLLHVLSKPTLFTLDNDFHKMTLCHHRYCIVVLRVDRYRAADFIRRFLKHPRFRTHKQRLGWVIEVQSSGLMGWHVGSMHEETFSWA